MSVSQLSKTIVGIATILLVICFDYTECDAHLSKSNDGTTELIGYCAPYHGKVCKSYITTGQVWYSNVRIIYLFIHFYFSFPNRNS